MSNEIMLTSSLKIGDIELKNRIVISPMCQYSAKEGFANDWHLVHLGSRAVGGAGLILQEATAISPEGRISYGDLGIWKDEHVEFYKRITDFVHSQNALIGIQLAHAGRKASTELPWKGGEQLPPEAINGWQTVGPSSIRFKEGQHLPEILDLDQIEQIKIDFKEATKRAIEAGYDVIEIHAAHGYLLHQFYSPISNHRTDGYGGSFENRIRLTLEVVESVQEIWGKDRTLFVRISATDWKDGGWGIEDSVKLCERLKEKGVHLIDTSSGGNVLADIPVKANYQVPFSAQIKKDVGIATGAVGLITQPEQAEEILKKEEADLIVIARESLRNPNFPLYAAVKLGDDSKENWPDQYVRAFPTHGEWGFKF